MKPRHRRGFSNERVVEVPSHSSLHLAEPFREYILRVRTTGCDNAMCCYATLREPPTLLRPELIVSAHCVSDSLDDLLVMSLDQLEIERDYEAQA